jgi:hypothetical protein
VVPLVEVLVDVLEDQRVAEVADDELLDVGLGAEVVVAERVQGFLNPLVDGLHVCGAEDGLCVELCCDLLAHPLGVLDELGDVIVCSSSDECHDAFAGLRRGGLCDSV